MWLASWYRFWGICRKCWRGMFLLAIMSQIYYHRAVIDHLVVWVESNQSVKSVFWLKGIQIEDNNGICPCLHLWEHKWTPISFLLTSSGLINDYNAPCNHSNFGSKLMVDHLDCSPIFSLCLFTLNQNRHNDVSRYLPKMFVSIHKRWLISLLNVAYYFCQNLCFN